jgi:hypothetical protein
VFLFSNGTQQGWAEIDLIEARLRILRLYLRSAGQQGFFLGFAWGQAQTLDCGSKATAKRLLLQAQ